MIWQAICTCGKKSAPYFTFGTINANIYKEECLKKRLWPLLASHDCDTLFWPDLASCHYQKDVLKWLNEMEVCYVEKNINPPNCPLLRPIEIFWAKMKSMLKKNYLGAYTIDDLKNHWKAVGRNMTKERVKNLMEHVKQKVRKFASDKN